MLDIHLRAVKDQFLARILWVVPPSVTPNQVTLLAFLMGLSCASLAACGAYGAALALWAANRILDGLDGTIARARGQQTAFGGYLDIVTDFTVYALVPIGVVTGQQQLQQASPLIDESDIGTAERFPWMWLWLALMEGVFFVNAGGLFMLSAILEGKAARASAREVTTVTMPPGLVEGTETVVVFSLFLLLPNHCVYLFAAFALTVAYTVLQRLLWAASVL